MLSEENHFFLLLFPAENVQIVLIDLLVCFCFDLKRLLITTLALL